MGSCGVRCLKQDLQDILGIFGMGECTGGVDGQGGTWAWVVAASLSEAGFAGFLGDFRD